MIRKILLFLFSTIIGVLLTIGIYMLFARQHIVVVSPLAVSHFSLDQAPSKSLVGVLTHISGNVLWQSRVAEIPVAATNEQHVQQGEEVGTDNTGSAVLLFDGIAEIRISRNTQLAIIQTLPANMVVDEKTGFVTYQVLGSGMPISVRGLDLLLAIQDGKLSVAVDKDTSIVTARVASGSAHIAYTNTNNMTIAKTMSTGQKITFNNNTKTLIFSR